LLKKFISAFLVVAIIIVALPINICFAETVYGPVVDLKANKIADKPDGITIALDFVQNPGIGAMAFTIKYDNTVFETKALRKRYFYSSTLKGYLIVDHPESGYVSVVWADGSTDVDFTGTGSLVQLDFNIKNRIKGEYVFSASNSNPSQRGTDLSGAFANFKKDTLVPTINPVTVYVGEKGYCSSYSQHDFTDWETINPSCELDGVKQRYCKNCDFSESEAVSATGHDYSSEWTVDRQAQDGVLGIKSRHCNNCSATTDKKYFSVENGKEVEKKTETKTKENNTSTIEKVLDIDEDNDTVDLEEIPDADTIIEKYKEEEEKAKTVGDIFTKIYKYLFGSEKEKGLIDTIIDLIKKAFTK